MAEGTGGGRRGQTHTLRESLSPLLWTILPIQIGFPEQLIVPFDPFRTGPLG